MSAYPSLPLFTDAFLADTGHLSAQETGAYLLLIMMAWRSPECRIPDDDAKLARWARVDKRTWLRIKPTVMEFWTIENGFWAQKRLSKERDFVSKRAEVARQNGLHGGRPKSLENNESHNPAGSSRVTQKKAPNPNPSPNTSSLRSDVCETPDGATPKKGTVLSGDWAAKDRHLAKAAERGFPEGFVQDQADRMRNWALSNSNRAIAKKADWDRTFDNWLGEAMDKAATRRPPPTDRPPRKSAQATFLDIAREAHEQLNTRSEDHERPFDGEILGPGRPYQAARHGHLTVYERPGDEAGERYEEGYPGRVRAFG